MNNRDGDNIPASVGLEIEEADADSMDLPPPISFSNFVSHNAIYFRISIAK